MADIVVDPVLEVTQLDGSVKRAYTENDLCGLLDQMSRIRLALYDRKIDEALDVLQRVQSEMRSRLSGLRGRVFDQDDDTAHFPHQPGHGQRRGW